MIAQWRRDRILASYDITQQVYEAAATQARGLTSPVVLSFPDISTFRARIRALAESVCTAPDFAAAKKALDELEAGRKDIVGRFQAWTGVGESMKRAWGALRDRTTEQLKPYIAELKKRNTQLIAAERDRLVKAGLTREQVTQQMQAYITRLRESANKEIQARVAELRKPDADRLQAISGIFKEHKAKQEAHTRAGNAEWPQIWKQVVLKRKELYLRDIDARIAKAKANIQENARGLSTQERDTRGLTALLAAIDRARGDLGPALEAALTAANPEGAKQAITTFYKRWDEANVRQICTSGLPKLQKSQEWANKTLELLRVRSPQTPQVQAAIGAISTWVQDIQKAQQLCAATPVPTFKQVQEAMKKTVQDAAEVKRAMDALKAGAKP